LKRSRHTPQQIIRKLREPSWVEWRLLALEIEDGVHARRILTGQSLGAVKRVAGQRGYGIESVRTWVKMAVLAQA
jgi:hypothetical protein